MKGVAHSQFRNIICYANTRYLGAKINQSTKSLSISRRHHVVGKFELQWENQHGGYRGCGMLKVIQGHSCRQRFASKILYGTS